MDGFCPEGVGYPQAPDWPLLRPVEHACGVAFSPPYGRCSCTSAQEGWCPDNLELVLAKLPV